MSNQGLLGALVQYWTIDEKPRLYRRNTYFDDNLLVSNKDALRIGMVFSVLATAIIIFWSLLGVVL